MFGKMLIAVVLAVFAAIISFVALKHFTLPYLWIALTWAAVLLCAWVLAPRVRAVWISAILAIGVLAGLEALSWISDVWVFRDIKKTGTFEWVPDEVVGYRGRKSAAQTEAKYYRGEKLYDVVYTMEENGWRITSTEAPGQRGGKPCILFFGGSYAFGWGLNDQDTLPYRVRARAGGKVDVYNLSFMTHGPHQMLAALERGVLSSSISCKPNEIKHVIYESSPTDVRRAAGLQDGIDLHRAPQYVLGADGGVTYQGRFGDDRTIVEKISRQLSKSYLARNLAGGDAVHYRRATSEDVALYAAIMESARRRAKSLYPTSDFHVLLWENDALDKDGVLAGRMLKALEGKGLTVHRVNDVLPGSAKEKSDYFLGVYDLHPNPMANDRLAEFIVGGMLK
jgi:hypothetical protein